MPLGLLASSVPKVSSTCACSPETLGPPPASPPRELAGGRAGESSSESPPGHRIALDLVRLLSLGTSWKVSGGGLTDLARVL